MLIRKKKSYDNLKLPVIYSNDNCSGLQEETIINYNIIKNIMNTIKDDMQRYITKFMKSGF